MALSPSDSRARRLAMRPVFKFPTPTFEPFLANSVSCYFLH